CAAIGSRWKYLRMRSSRSVQYSRTASDASMCRKVVETCMAGFTYSFPESLSMGEARGAPGAAVDDDESTTNDQRRAVEPPGFAGPGLAGPGLAGPGFPGAALPAPPALAAKGLGGAMSSSSAGADSGSTS